MKARTLSFLRTSLTVFGFVLFSHLTGIAEEKSPPPSETLASDPIVMTIEGAPVSVAEFKLVMEGHISDVAGHFHALGIDDHQGYWNDKEGAETPIGLLRKFVIEDLKRIKTTQSWAQEKGLINDISFAAYREHLTAENVRRKATVESGGVIYGPKQYKAYRYYFFRLRDLDQALLEKLAESPEYALPEAEVVAYYNENKEVFAGRALEDIRAQILSFLQKKKYEAALKERIAAAKVEVDEAVLKTIAPRHDS